MPFQERIKNFLASQNVRLEPGDIFTLAGLVFFSTFSILTAHAVGFSIGLYPNAGVFFDGTFLKHISVQLLWYLILCSVVGRASGFFVVVLLRFCWTIWSLISGRVVGKKDVDVVTSAEDKANTFILLCGRLIQWVVFLLSFITQYLGLKRSQCDLNAISTRLSAWVAM